MKGNKTKKRGRKPIGSGRKDQNLRKGYQTEDRDIQRYHADARDREDIKNSKSNDWTWYAQSPQLVKDYASYPFGVAVGTQLPLSSMPLGQVGVPGVMALEFCPTIGEALTPNSPVNIASRNIYSFVRHANSGHANYEAPDLMLYLLAMDSLYMYRSFLTRLLGVLNAYTPVNRYYPKALVQLMSVDFDDIVKHIPDLRGYINQYGVKMGSMCVPNSMPYYARHSWMCEGYYVDSNTTKAQTYMYVPRTFLKLTFNTDSSLHELETAIFKTSGDSYNYDQIVQFGNDLINPILMNEDFNIMSGDILKAFGADGVVKVASIPDGYLCLPSYNQEVQSQIENATVLDAWPNFTISQNPDIGKGYLVAYEKGTKSRVRDLFYRTVDLDLSTVDDAPSEKKIKDLLNPVLGEKVLLNFHHDSVTPEEVMVATRLTNTIQISKSVATLSGSSVRLWQTLSVPTMGSEVITRIAIAYYGYANDVFSLRVYQGFGTKTPNYMLQTAGATTFRTVYQGTTTIAGYMETFDWAPQIYPMLCSYTPATTAGGGTLELWGPYSVYMDIDNYTVIDTDNLVNMSLAALLSEFNVPQMGAFANK